MPRKFRQINAKDGVKFVEIKWGDRAFVHHSDSSILESTFYTLAICIDLVAKNAFEEL